METPNVLFLEKHFSTTFVTKFRVFHVLIWKFSKKLHRLIFFRNELSRSYFKKWRHKKLYFLKNFFRQLCNDSSCIFYYDSQVHEKIAPFGFFFKRMVRNIYLGHGDNKGCVFRKIFFDYFCNERSWVSSSDLQVLEKIALFNYLRNKLFHSFI